MLTKPSLYERINYKVHSLFWYFRRRALTPEPAWHRIDDDFEMKLVSQDMMDQAFLLGNYSPALLCALDMFVAEANHCIDIGAHKGYVSLTLSSRVGPSGRVFAFEPDTDVRTALVENAQHNGRDNIQIFPYALGLEEGEATFFLNEQSGWSSRFPNELVKSKIRSEVKVPIRALDALVSNQEVPVNPERLSFVKIDCEGSEPGVLAGMRNLLVTATPVLWIEVNRGSLLAANSSVAALEQILLELGQNLYSYEFHKQPWGKSSLQFQPLAHIPAETDSAFDIVATRQKLV